MKAIMMSIKPQHVANILNKIKTLEIRKRFPKDYVGWVYIYCTKDKKYANLINRGGFLTGMVVARFWCDKVEEQPANRPIEEYVFKQGCLTSDDILNYCGYKTFYAIHVANLEPFDKPKEISEFKYICPNVLCDKCKYGSKEIDLALPICKRQLTRAPESYCYIEV